MKQTISILFLSQLYHPSVGGVQKHVEEISKKLIKRGFEISLITENFDKSLPPSENINGVMVYRIPIGKNEFLKKFLIWKWIFLHFSMFWKADIIHVHDVFYWILPFRVFLPFKKIFMTFHGYEGYPVKKRWVTARKIAEKLTKGNICIGDFMTKWYKTKPSFVSFGAVEQVKSEKVKNLKSAVFFGRLDSQTGILEYAKAYEILKKEYPDFKFTIIGEGKLKGKLPKNIEVLPFKKEVADDISKNHFIFVSRYLSILESLAQKRIVIATYDNPIKKDYLMMSPFKKYISIAENSEEIAKFVDFYLKNREKEEKVVEDGFNFAKKQTWEKMTDTYVKLWQKN
jgi:glycosyltransferase involved in cell wall biosynthesis